MIANRLGLSGFCVGACLLTLVECTASDGDKSAPPGTSDRPGDTARDPRADAGPAEAGGPKVLDPLPLQPGISALADTRRGTDSKESFSHGNTFPAAAVPFGFNLWTPITNGDSGGVLYEFADETIEGFGLSHQPSPWMGDYGSVQIWPMTGKLESDPGRRAQRFEHASETTKPFQYSVTLANGIVTEIAPTDHAASFRFTFPAASSSYILLDGIKSLHGTLNVDNATSSIRGYTDGDGQRLYLYAEIVGKTVSSSGAPGGRPVGAWVSFPTTEGEQLTMNVGSSWISEDQAKANMKQEIGAKTWTQVRDEAAAAWDTIFSRVKLDGATDAQKTIFYSNLYRVYLYPTSRWESISGIPMYASPYDGIVHQGKMWVNNGFWDTYRSEWPWLMLMHPDTTGVMLDGFVHSYVEGGWTPRWSSPGYANLMTGTHTDVVFADAYTKGIRNFDYERAYDSATKNAMVYSPEPSKGRKGIERTIFVGYTPSDTIGESGAWHLEGCVNDFGISRMAAALGKTTDAEYFKSRALTYVNSFSPSVGFFRGRKLDGSWRTSDADFSATDWWREFTEGNAWQYAFSAPFDARGLANLYGGLDGLAKKLDELFAAPRTTGGVHEQAEAYAVNMGQYGHSNETVHHVIYMYNYAGKPWKTQEHARAVLDPARGLYTVGADGKGWLGDEDNGQMSAWFVFSALGFYPATGGHGEYLIGSPLYSRAAISPENGKVFAVGTVDSSDTNIYIQSATLNGAPYTKNFLTHADLVAGGELILTMGPTPSKWGSGPDDLPSSVTTSAAVAAPLRDMAVGGEVTASSDNGPGEAKEKAFDDTSLTKWLAKSATATLQYRFPDNAKRAVTLYTLTSADDFPGRDPRTWTLQGSNDGSTWSTLDTRTNEAFPWRRMTRVFAVPGGAAYSYYRLQLANGGTEEYLQLAEVELLAAP